MMKRYGPVANGLGFFFAVLLLKYAAWLWRLFAYDRDFDGASAGVGSVIILSGIPVLSIWAIVSLYRTPSVLSFARMSGLLLAVLIPSYDWIEAAWKVELNASHYKELIKSSKSDPKLAVLEERESAVGASYTIWTWIVYDESDQVVLPPHLRPKVWQNPVLSNLSAAMYEKKCMNTVDTIKTHYFYATAECAK